MADLSLAQVFDRYLTACPEVRGNQRGVINRLGKDPLVGKLDALTYTPQQVIAFAKSREVQPCTLAQDISYWLGAVEYAEVGLGLVGVDGRAIRKAMPILKQQRLVGSGNARERIPEPEEHVQIIAYLMSTRTAPVTVEVIDYQYHSGRRISESCRHQWGQFDAATKTIVVADMKHPRKKAGHTKRLALTDEAFAIIIRQPRMTNDPAERIFKANVGTVKHAYQRAKAELDITDLHLHDSRAGVVTRLLSEGKTPQEVQLVTGNGIEMIMKHYNRMKPENFPRAAA
jgi:integrase